MECSVEQMIRIQRMYRGYRLRKKLKTVLAQYQKTMNEAFNFPIHPAPKSFKDYYKNEAYDRLLSEYFELKQALDEIEASQSASSD